MGVRRAPELSWNDSADDGNEAAKRRFLSVKPRVLSADGRYPSRDELHDRPRLC